MAGRWKPIQNKPLIQNVHDKFIEARSAVAIKFEHVFSHTDNTDPRSIGNARADFLAKEKGSKGLSQYVIKVDKARVAKHVIRASMDTGNAPTTLVGGRRQDRIML